MLKLQKQPLGVKQMFQRMFYITKNLYWNEAWVRDSTEYRDMYVFHAKNAELNILIHLHYSKETSQPY